MKVSDLKKILDLIPDDYEILNPWYEEDVIDGMHYAYDKTMDFVTVSKLLHTVGFNSLMDSEKYDKGSLESIGKKIKLWTENNPGQNWMEFYSIDKETFNVIKS